MLTKQTELISSLIDMSRKPSRYLKALLKFEPKRRKVINIMFNDNKSVDLELLLNNVLAPLI